MHRITLSRNIGDIKCNCNTRGFGYHARLVSTSGQQVIVCWTAVPSEYDGKGTESAPAFNTLNPTAVIDDRE